jgi:dihydroorotate dehydrogenase electron transfer subunit
VSAATAAGTIAPAVLERGVVSLREEVMPGVWKLRFHSPRIAGAGLPGQFVHIQCAQTSDPLLRRPFSFCDINVAAGTYDVLFNVTGAGTAILAAAEAGQAFEALGPLGQPFTLPSDGTLVAVAGGLGVAPFPLVARVASARGVGFRWLNGAYTSHQLLPARELPAGIDAHAATDDGSAGHHGVVTDVLADQLDAAADIAIIHVCGPMPMLQAVARLLHDRDERGTPSPPCEMSLEAPMGCALGTCLGCVVPSSDGGFARICVEGAVMDWRAVDWARLARMGELIHHHGDSQRFDADARVGD